MPNLPGPRFSHLQKRLERRNNSLKPTYNKNGRKEAQEGSEEVVPDLIGSTDTPSADLDSRSKEDGDIREFPPEEAIVDPLIERMRQIHSTIRGYLPVAMPRSSIPQPNRNEMNHQVDAEREYLSLLNSHIEVREKATFDDGVTEVSEITSDFRTLSTKGASYVERRLAGKLQKRLEQPRLDPVAYQASSAHLGPRGGNSGVNPELHDVGLTQSGSYVELDVNDLRHLNEAVEKAKKDLRAITPSEVVPRHGLPYEATDFRAEGDDDESEDIWDDVISDGRRMFGKHQRSHLANQRVQSAVDPEDGDVLCVRGPPTPKQRHSPKAKANPGNLQNLIVETLSDEGDVVIDTTEIRDEDLDGVSVLDGRGKASDDRTAETSVLLGEPLLAEDINSEQEIDKVLDKLPKYRRNVSKKSPRTTRKKRNDGTRSRNDDTSKSATAKRTTTSPKARSQTKAAAGADLPRKEANATSSYSGFEEHYIQDERVARDEPPSAYVKQIWNDDSTTAHDATRIASDFYSSSLGYFKSFVRQVDAQLKFVQRQGLITESDMDGMLNVLEQGMEETSKHVPEQSDDAIILLGEELERTTCGIDRSMGDHGRDLDFPTESVEKMLDSLKSTYKKSLATCGVDKTMIRENTRAMEDMVANLKLSYHKNAAACGKQEDVLTNCGKRDGTMFAAADRIVWGSSPSAALVPTGNSINPLLLAGGKSVRRQSSTALVPPQPSNVNTKDPRGEVVDQTLLKEKSAEAVEEMLQTVKETYSKKLSKIKTRRRKKAPPQEPQTFIVPINMPATQAPSSTSYSAIE